MSSTISIESLRRYVEQQKGKEAQVKKDLAEAERTLEAFKKDLISHEHAREVIKEVGNRTQEALSYHISDITTLALEAVFDDPYELKVEFVQRRNKTECDLLFIRNDHRIDPIDASGGGAVDAAAFALRIASWSMEVPRSRALIVLDEPFRFLSTDLQNRASAMIKELAARMGLQFVIITHEETLSEAADRVFVVRRKKAISKVVAYD